MLLGNGVVFLCKGIVYLLLLVRSPDIEVQFLVGVIGIDGERRLVLCLEEKGILSLLVTDRRENLNLWQGCCRNLRFHIYISMLTELILSQPVYGNDLILIVVVGLFES